MKNKYTKLIISIIFLISNLSIFGQIKYLNFYDDYLKANFLDTKFDTINGYYFEGYERGNMETFVKSSDLIKVYAQKPNYSRTEYPSNKGTYCYNGKELLKVSEATNFKPQTVPFALNLTTQQATFSMFFNGFVSRNSIRSANLIEKFVIVSDSIFLENTRFYKLIQKLDDEIGFEYFIEYDTFLLSRENSLKNGEIITQIDYSDYRKVNGIYFPFKKVEHGYQNRIYLERIILNFTLNPEIPKDFFECIEK